MSTRDALRLARHYQDMAHRSPDESRFWTARSLYYGRKATAPLGAVGGRTAAGRAATAPAN